MGKVQYTQKFRKEWLRDEKFKTWLMEVQGDSTKCFCKFCKCNLSPKYSDLEKHMNTSKHMKAAGDLNRKLQQKPITCSFKPVTDETKVVEGRICLYIAQHSSFRAVDHLTDMCKGMFKDSMCTHSLKLHRTKCTQIIRNVLSPHFESDLKNDIGEQPYSLLLDESNDISVNKLLASTIRYYSKSKSDVVVTFLDLAKLSDGTADSICNAIKNMLQRKGLDIKKLVGIGTDNASVMVGVNNGVYAKLKETVPNLQLIRCICHSLQLCISHATSEFLPRHLEFLVKETFNWFSHSALRQYAYKQMYAIINDGKRPLKIPQVSQTRWLSIEGAVSRILEQWEELKTHFSIAHTMERCYTADQLHMMYADRLNYLFLLFLQPILQEVNMVNLKFQSEKQDPTKLLNDVLLLLKSLTGKLLMPGMKFDVLTVVVEEHLDPSPYLGYQFEVEIRNNTLPENVEKDIRKKCVLFLKELVAQLRTRLPSNIKILQHMSLLSAQESLKPLKPSVVQLAALFCSDTSLLTKIERQWQNLHHVKWTEVSETVKLWCEVAEYKDSTGENPFKELSDFALCMLTLPHSNADVERVFSYVNLIKNKLRNVMETHTLVSILNVKFGLKRIGKCYHQYELPKEVLQKICTLESYDDNFSQPEPSTSQNPCLVEDALYDNQLKNWEL